MTEYPPVSSNGLELFPLPTADEIELQVRHAVPPPDTPRGHVVLIHGASAAYTTFTVPGGNSLFDALRREDFDVWFLDWRGSHEVSGYYLDKSRAITIPASVNRVWIWGSLIWPRCANVSASVRI